MTTNRSQEEQMTNPFGISKAEKEVPRSSGAPTGGRRAAHMFGGGYHTLATSRKGRRFKNAVRDSASASAGALPGAVTAGVGTGLMAHTMAKNPPPEFHNAMTGERLGRGIPRGSGKFKAGMLLTAAGVPAAMVGAQLARQKNLTSMNRKGYLKAEEKDKVGKSDTVSAFGVDHLEPVSKISFKPVTQGFKAMKFGNAPSVPKVTGRSYKAGIARGQSKFNAGLQAAGSAIRHSPGTALGVGGAGVAGVGGTGYLMGRRKD